VVAGIVASVADNDEGFLFLVAKVKAGGSGVWGTLPMPAQAHISDAQAESLVRWILGGAQ